MWKPKDPSGFWITTGILVAAASAVALGVYAGWLIGSTTGLFILAALVMLVLLYLAEAIARFAGGSFLYTVILGEDGRTSTSKTFVLIWTLLVGWALVSFLVAGEFLPAREALADLQRSWQAFLKSGLDGNYVVLLGIPAGAAIAAKAIVQQKVDSGAMPVVPLKDNEMRLSSRFTQLFSSDDGTTDIGDFQYVIFQPNPRRLLHHRGAPPH
jgi:formate-dependent nitrite reductase membrane component NrfD